MAGDTAVKVYRGDVLEAEHAISAAVVSAEGELTQFAGEPDAEYMTRSSVKPFQVLPVILSGAFDHFRFEERQLAIMCASHNGNDEHVAVVQSILDRIGVDASALGCGTHRPMIMQIEETYPTAGEDKDPRRHNCSGKHAGFLALAKYLNEPVETYLDTKSRVQRMVRESVARMCERSVGEVKVGIDGCSAPVFSMTLRHMAIGFKNLATGQGGDRETTEALKRVKKAMTSHPFLVSGEKRFDYHLMRAFAGNGVSKIGAESIQGMGFVDPPMGICVKVSDGAGRALGPACVHVLEKLGVFDKATDKGLLVEYVEPEVRNYRNLLTGRIVVDFALKKA